jgi:hypothetical protein
VAIALAVVAALVLAPAAGAAPAAGTPLDPAPGVPGQGRAWELVTFAEGSTAFLWNVFAISPDGGRLYYSTAGSLPDNPEAKPGIPVVLAERGARGWASRTVPPPDPELTGFEAGPAALAPNFESSLWENELPLDQGVGLFRRGPGGEYGLLVAGATLLGVSTDLHHVLVASASHLLAADASRVSGQSLYEIVGSELRLVDAGDDGALISNCGATTRDPNPISRDGRRIFFSASPGCGGPRSVYLREDGATTTRISASQCDLPDCGPAGDATFAGATPTGSSAYLVTAQRLTGEDADSRADLYRYDAGDGQLTLLSDAWPGGELLPTAEAARVPDHGSRVYFTAAEETAPGEASGPKLFMAGGDGVHRVSEAAPAGFMQVSGDGRYALFATPAPLVPGDLDTSTDVYRYDAADGSLVRVSAGPAGGNGPFGATIQPSGLVAEREAPSHPYRAMSDDGSRIFFTTAERLLAEDSNDASDAYELAAGKLALVSPGVGGEESEYAGATADGATALFSTAATLLPEDRDNGDLDIYAARTGGGFPAASPAGCEPACPPAPRGRSERATPASARPAGGRIRLGRIGAAERRRIAATGWIVLLAEVPKAGRLSARARARIGPRERTVAATAVRVARPGALQLRMRLSAPARRRLAAGHGLQVRLLLRHSRLDSVRRLGFRLGPES